MMETEYIIIIIVCGVVLLLIIGIILLVYCLKRRRGYTCIDGGKDKSSSYPVNQNETLTSEHSDNKKTPSEWWGTRQYENSFEEFPNTKDYRGYELEFCSERANENIKSSLQEKFSIKKWYNEKVTKDKFDAYSLETQNFLLQNTKDALCKIGIYKLSLNGARNYLVTRYPAIVERMFNDTGTDEKNLMESIKDTLYEKVSAREKYDLKNAEKYLCSQQNIDGCDNDICKLFEDSNLYGSDLEEELDFLAQELILRKFKSASIDELRKAKIIVKK